MSFTTVQPTNTPAVPHTHQHTEGKCPVTGNTHEYCPPSHSDLRSPCPALNTLANHGYLPRDGKRIGPMDLVHALKEGYHLSTLLACILSFGGMMLLGQVRYMSLWDLSRHNLIEHNASLVHDDDLEDAEYASTTVDEKLLAVLCEEAGQVLPDRMTTEDVARIRVKREAQCDQLDPLHAEIARGEMAIAIGVLGGSDADKSGVEIEKLRYWLKNERLPLGWKPNHTQGLYKTYKMSKYIRHRMAELKKVHPELSSSSSSSSEISSSSSGALRSGFHGH